MHDEPGWLVRLREEQKELADKIEKLFRFLATPNRIKDLSVDMILLMQRQYDTMCEYNRILLKRLDLIEKGMHTKESESL